MSAPATPKRRVPPRLWLHLLLVFLGSAAVVAVLPLLTQERGPAPPVGLLLLAGLLIAGIAAAVLHRSVARDLALPRRAALYAIGYNALIVLVKFVLSPFGVYETNRRVNLTWHLNITDPMGAALTALIVLALYVLVYWFLYRLVRRRVADLLPSRQKRSRAKVVVPLVAVALLLVGLSGSGVLFLPLLLAGGAAEYLSFVFTSGMSLLVGLVLAAASILLTLSFEAAAERATVVRDASAFVGLFWVGLGFIAVYHVLWVVFILILAATWPLRVVVPK